MRTASLLLVVSATLALGQGDDTAKTVYSQSQDSVFLIYLNDGGGNATALGTGFLVAPKTLITNAHVVEAGDPVLAVGPVRLPLKVVRVDKKNDLALLSVDANLTSRPLPLAAAELSPGEQIFAIGSPEGLEKTISQGIVSAVRKGDSRDLIQITSPISHGSSGGPILNSRGEVVGVAVGMLQDGQNLNFAVPVKFVRSILESKDAPSSTPINSALAVSDAVALLEKRQGEEYSADQSSQYQKDTAKLVETVRELAKSSNDVKTLSEVACIGTRAADLSDDGIAAARKLVKAKPSPENRSLLSYVLWDRATNEGFIAAISDKNSDEKAKAEAAQREFVSQAEAEAHEATVGAKASQLMISDFVLANVRQFQGKFQEAVSLHSTVVDGKPKVCGSDLTSAAYAHLIAESNSLARPVETEKWFRRYAADFEPTAYQWDNEGDRRWAANDYSAAADAYERAAGAEPSLSYDLCFASKARYLLRLDSQKDAVLSDGRRCVDASVKQTDAESQKYFNSELPIVYDEMAMILKERGVYSQALEYIKESLASEPNNAFYQYDEAEIFEGMERYSECIAAAQSAIRQSDGKYPWMNFRLGTCYFSAENWSKAEASFKLSAQADPSDAPSAFNLGLSLARQGYTDDANQWFRQALKRNPDSELRDKILNAMK